MEIEKGTLKSNSHLHRKCSSNTDDYFLFVIIDANEEGSFSHIHMIGDIHHLHSVTVNHLQQGRSVSILKSVRIFKIFRWLSQRFLRVRSLNRTTLGINAVLSFEYQKAFMEEQQFKE